MKRIVTLLIALAFIVGLFSVPSSRAVAQEVEMNGSIDLIIQTDGPTSALIDKIEAVGGTVKYAYRNIPAVAVSIPATKVAEVIDFQGVTRYEKDKLVYPSVEKDTSGPTSYAVKDMKGIKVKAVDPSAIKPKIQPLGYANFMYTGADQIWEATGFGEGSVVAVVDTGTVPNVCLEHAVIGAPGYPDGYNATGDGVPATDPNNHWHGTHVGGVIASACSLDFSDDPSDPLYQAVAAYLPWPVDFVPIYGEAPSAQLYPVKVFPQDGGGSPTSVILDGLDHVLSLKVDKLLDVDVVNMSLSGGAVYDEGDAYDVMLKAFYKNQIFVVSSASNDGPTPNSIGSPATTKVSLAVGALDYAPSSRVLYEYLGLTYGMGAGQGLVMRPTDEVRVTNFSSRGPLRTGHLGLDISALGLWNFQAGPNNEIRWAGGTSFSSPTVAGVAALLNAWKEARTGGDTGVYNLRAALLLGADPDVVGESWQAPVDQGFGTLDAVGAFEHLRTRDLAITYPLKVGKLTANVMGDAMRGQVETYETEAFTLNASEKFDAVFKISPFTSKVNIEIFDIVTADNSAYAFWPNSLEVHVQDARSTGVESALGLYWYPYAYGDAFNIEVEDGPWTVDGSEAYYAPMLPGLMKVTLIGDYSNEASVSFKMRVTRENFKPALHGRVAEADINMGDTFVVPVEIPENTDKATFDLTFRRNWTKFPTSDIDMLLFDPEFNLAATDGASLNAPERSVISEPMAGTWYVYIDGFEMYWPDHFKLFMNLETGEPYPAP
jgi:subtilisin family serine protease